LNFQVRECFDGKKHLLLSSNKIGDVIIPSLKKRRTSLSGLMENGQNT